MSQQLAVLLQQREELDAKIAAEEQAAKAESITKVKTLMAELGVTTRMLNPRSKAASKAARARHPSAGKKVAAKYANQAGETWSGRGLRPKWLREAIEAGAALESFAV